MAGGDHLKRNGAEVRRGDVAVSESLLDVRSP